MLMPPRPIAHEPLHAFGRIAAPCAYFGTCGGCALQDLSYEDQCALKRDRIQRAFASLGPMPTIEFVGLDEPWRYRNKAELTFSERDARLVLGYHQARSFSHIVDLEDCLLMPAPAMAVARTVLECARQSGLPAYHPRTHQGFFRYLVVRYSHATQTMLLCLMTTPGMREVVEVMAREVMARHPEVASVYWGLTSKLADIAVPDTLQLLRGAAHLEDQLGPFRLRLHPLSFLQSTSVQAARMYERLAQALAAVSPSVAWDLYCGVGLIGFYLSRCARQVYAIDSEPHHLEWAAVNASLNGIGNISFHAGHVETLLQDRRFWLHEAKPDVIVVDPPRTGLHVRALSSLLAARPVHMAYFSCNVQSLIRDLRILLGSFPRYRVVEAVAFDMFPQTNHAELFVLLERMA